MTLEERTYKEMQDSSIAYLKLHELLWTPKIRLKTNIDLLIDNQTELGLAVQAQSDNNTGGLVDKKNALTLQLNKKFFPFSRKLSFYAMDTGDLVLLDDVKFGKNEYKQSTLTDYLAQCATILKRGREYLVKPDIEITELEITSLEKELKDVKEMPAAIQIVLNERKSATRSIKEINAESRTIFEKVDTGLEAFFSDNDEFIKGWFQVRKIKGRPDRRNPTTPA